ncbi:MAG TPA: molybdenum cofactor biosynthesis protein MoaE [Opitutaceae bacterium]|jgi:molybdopterin synthase catalytic subunit|nr:molybdenum cofactor biosynthesis protein MoaE [Opitutaceae bacterium]
MFKISPIPFDLDRLRHELAHPRAGAFATFEGWVRDLNDGQPVLSLEYEAFVPLAEKEGARILAEAREKFPLLGASCFHRTGHLRIGELAVWVGVTAEHRAAAFDACRQIIDEVKARVPIWKKEHYAGGASAWVNGASRGESVGALPPNFG